jgi:hypothetical protein
MIEERKAKPYFNYCFEFLIADRKPDRTVQAGYQTASRIVSEGLSGVFHWY